MNYDAHYSRLVERARGRILTGYAERHHVIPKCVGGGDDASNLVRLTAEEHYIAHQLLVKLYPGHHRLLWAAVAMTNGAEKQARKNKLYGWLRRRFAAQVGQRSTGRKASAEAKQRMSVARRGKRRAPHSSEAKLKISLSQSGIPKSAAHKAALAQAKLGVRRESPSADTRQKMSDSNKRTRAMLGRASFLDDSSYREAQRERMADVWARRKIGELPMPNHEHRKAG